MERVISQEDRIRRAEEIYYRKLAGMNMPKAKIINANSKKNYAFWKKVLVQMVISTCICGTIYQLQKNTDNFSTDLIVYVKGIMAYDIDTNKALGEIKKYMPEFNKTSEENKTDENIVSDNIVTEEPETNSDMAEETPVEVQQTDENNEEEQQDETTTLSQMEQDAKYIKENFSFIKPVVGTVTSRFGLRNPSTPTVPKNHTGIDIGVVEGTVFVAAMEGTVEVVSSVGDYRKSHKSNKWRCIHSLCTL